MTEEKEKKKVIPKEMPKDEKQLDKKDEEIKKLQAEILKCKEELKAKDNGIMLAKADLINYRKRKDEEVSSMLKYANQDLISELLDIVDNFERAIKLDDNDLTDEVSKFLAGFKMMYANFTDILKKYGVEEINNVGKPFNPNEEQALLTDNIADVDNDIVIEVLLKGYKLKGKVIRPASVKINQK